MEDDNEESLYYEGAGVEAIKKWRQMSEQEKAALRKGDDIDAVNTTDLEAEDSDVNEVSFEFFEHNRINLARAFLGMDGGYSVRKLKKFYLRDKEMKRQRLAEEEAQRKSYRQQAEEEAPAEAAPV